MMKRLSTSGPAMALAAAAAALWPGAAALAADAIPAERQVESVMTSAGPIAVERLADELEDPWGMAFLPDGRLLITERPGKLRILGLDGRLSDPVKGTPVVYAQGQGGLMDVALHPSFADNRQVYLSYARPGPEGQAATALGRGRLVDGSLEEFEVLFTQQPWITGPYHFGNRIVFDDAGHVFLALGERFQYEPAQELGNHLGKVIRLNADGSVPDDNPFVERSDAEAAIWSYGHRNIEAAAIDPESGALWVGEMGPLGGDELNRVEAGRNYGWPVVSWGIRYSGQDIPDPPTRPEFADAVAHWSPVFSPSGMIFYTGAAFPPWQGSAILGGLSAHELVRLVIEDKAVTQEERIPLPGRVRDVEQGPDGHIYVLHSPLQHDGALWRLRPLD